MQKMKLIEYIKTIDKGKNLSHDALKYRTSPIRHTILGKEIKNKYLYISIDTYCVLLRGLFLIPIRHSTPIPLF